MKELFCILAFIISISFSSFSQIADLPKVKASNVYEDLTNEWLVFDEDRENYVPYFPEVHQSYRALHLVVDFDEQQNRYANKYLGLVLPKATKVFWNKRLSTSISSNQYLEVSLDSLQKVYSTTKVLLTIYTEKSASYSAYTLTATNSFQQRSTNTYTSQQKSFVPTLRNKFYALDWLLISNWIMVSLIVIFSVVVYPIIGREPFTQTWLYFLRPATALKRTELFPQVGFVLYFGLVMGFIWTFYDVIFLKSISFSSINILFEWLKAAFWFSLVGVVRLNWIKLMANLYVKKGGLADLHVQLLLNSSIFTMGFLFVGTLILTPLWETIASELSSNWSTGYVWTVSIIFVIHSLLISYYLFLRTGVSKLYLFSYLCATEILPLLVAAKWVLS